MKCFFFFMIIILLTSCAKSPDQKQLMSPCSSKEGGVCERIPINQWWMQREKII